jgi:hypothetical protein
MNIAAQSDCTDAKSVDPEAFQFDAIPRDLQEAFREALGEYVRWFGSAPEPLVGFRNGAETISAACRMVVGFKDPMPDVVRIRLIGLIGLTDRGMRSLRSQLIKDGSYENGGRALLAMINARKVIYR